MMRSGVLGLLGAGLLGACAQGPSGSTVPVQVAEPLRVTNGTRPFANFEGAAARKLAETTCKSRGQRLHSSIYDRYEAGAWVFVEGCA
jgi:hypothetical protein